MGKGRQRGMKRAHLRRWSANVINGGQGVDKRYVDQHKDNSRSHGRISGGGKHIELQDSGMPFLPQLVHPDPMPIARSHHTGMEEITNLDGKVLKPGTYIPATPPERIAVEKRLRTERLAERVKVLWQAEPRLQRWDVLPKILVYTGKITKIKIWMYYGTDRFIFVEETETRYRGSIVYTSRHRAMMALGNPPTLHNRITWAEVQLKLK